MSKSAFTLRPISIIIPTMTSSAMSPGTNPFPRWPSVTTGKPPLLQRRRRIFLVADFRGKRSGEILFKPRSMLPYPASCRKNRSSSARTHQSNLIKARGKIPIVHPFQERRMRGAAKERDRGNFLGSFGRPDDPFPTLLAGGINYFVFWYEGDEENGFIRYLTPTECERLQGLPEDWTK